jgi:hypothetical protein
MTIIYRLSKVVPGWVSFPLGPNVVIEWLTLLLVIREVPGSILCPGNRLS